MYKKILCMVGISFLVLFDTVSAAESRPPRRLIIATASPSGATGRPRGSTETLSMESSAATPASGETERSRGGTEASRESSAATPRSDTSASGGGVGAASSASPVARDMRTRASSGFGAASGGGAAYPDEDPVDKTKTFFQHAKSLFSRKPVTFAQYQQKHGYGHPVEGHEDEPHDPDAMTTAEIMQRLKISAPDSARRF